MTTKPSPFRELGVTGRAQFGRVQYVDPDSALRGISAIRTYDEMRRTDPTGMAMFQVLSLPLRRVTWRCDPGGEKTTADQQAADFVWSCFNDMSHTFNDFIADVGCFSAFGHEQAERAPTSRILHWQATHSKSTFAVLADNVMS